MPTVQPEHMTQARILVRQIRERSPEAGYSDNEFYLRAYADVSDELLAFSKLATQGMRAMLNSRQVVFTQEQRLWLERHLAIGNAAIANAEQG